MAKVHIKIDKIYNIPLTESNNSRTLTVSLEPENESTTIQINGIVELITDNIWNFFVDHPSTQLIRFYLTETQPEFKVLGDFSYPISFLKEGELNKIQYIIGVDPVTRSRITLRAFIHYNNDDSKPFHPEKESVSFHLFPKKKHIPASSLPSILTSTEVDQRKVQPEKTHSKIKGNTEEAESFFQSLEWDTQAEDEEDNRNDSNISDFSDVSDMSNNQKHKKHRSRSNSHSHSHHSHHSHHSRSEKNLNRSGHVRKPSRDIVVLECESPKSKKSISQIFNRRSSTLPPGSQIELLVFDDSEKK